MKTAVEIILEIEDLSQEEREKLDEYLNANKEVEFLKEDYSPEDIAMLDRIQAEAEQGINVSRGFENNGGVNNIPSPIPKRIKWRLSFIKDF